MAKRRLPVSSVALEPRHWGILDRKGERGPTLRKVLDRYDHIMESLGYDLALKWGDPFLGAVVIELKNCGNLAATGKALDAEIQGAIDRVSATLPSMMLRNRVSDLTEYEKLYLIDAAEVKA